MFHSRSFIAHAEKTRKHHREDPEAIARELESLFVRQLSHLPSELSSDLFAHCWSTRTEPMDRIQALADVVDLLFQQYDDETDPLTTHDWEALRDSIDQYALEVDMTLVQYIMERVVDHHAL